MGWRRARQSIGPRRLLGLATRRAPRRGGRGLSCARTHAPGATHPYELQLINPPMRLTTLTIAIVALGLAGCAGAGGLQTGLRGSQPKVVLVSDLTIASEVVAIDR